MKYTIFRRFQDLCERHEKGVLNDHQRALQKMGQYKKKRMSATVQGPAEVGGTFRSSLHSSNFIPLVPDIRNSLDYCQICEYVTIILYIS